MVLRAVSEPRETLFMEPGRENRPRSSCRRTTGNRRLAARAFSLVELVIVVTIIGIISAIAVPRMSSVTNRASSNALEATLTNVRKAIDCYYAEHNGYPGYDPSLGSANGTWFVNQLVMYTDRNGQTGATRTAAYIYGPYLRKPFPKNPANKLDTVHVKAITADGDPAAGTFGWIAVLSTGDFGISATDSELEDIGVMTPKKKGNVRIQ